MGPIFERHRSTQSRLGQLDARPQGADSRQRFEGPSERTPGQRRIAGSQRMAALIDDLLTFSRLSRQSLNRQTVDMNMLARRAAAEVLESQPEPKPAVNIAQLPPVPGDPALLRQVWTNLISNAVKYSSKSAAPEVRIRAETEGRLVR